MFPRPPRRQVRAPHSTSLARGSSHAVRRSTTHYHDCGGGDSGHTSSRDRRRGPFETSEGLNAGRRAGDWVVRHVCMCVNPRYFTDVGGGNRFYSRVITDNYPVFTLLVKVK